MQELVIEGYANPMIQLRGIKFVPPKQEVRQRVDMFDLLLKMQDFEQHFWEYIKMNRYIFPNLDFQLAKKEAWSKGINVAEMLRMRRRY